MKLKKINKGFIEEYCKKYAEKDSKESNSDKAIVKLVKLLPKNNNLSDIQLKVSVINDLYGTNIFYTPAMAEHILSLDVDKEIEKGSPEIVEKIAKIRINKKKKAKKMYSFATKYCSWHNQAKYPIFDSKVERLLKKYNKQDKFSEQNMQNLKDYTVFKKVVEDFIEHNKLRGINFKKIDMALWEYARELFPYK